MSPSSLRRVRGLPGGICLVAGLSRVAACSSAEETVPSCGDLGTNDNCGACGDVCAPDAFCMNGTCTVPPCGGEGPAALTPCDGTCVNLAQNHDHCGACGVACDGSSVCEAGVCKRIPSLIEHVVLIVQENHSFDAYFGHYCKAEAGSSPACTEGPSCCEGAPAKEPIGASPELLDDLSNAARDRNHDMACELDQIHGGKMDRFVFGSTYKPSSILEPPCSSTHNFAVANEETVKDYWAFASAGALADRYFQPIAGGSASNDAYFAIARFQFKNNDFYPDSLASGCAMPLPVTKTKWQGRKTVGDLLLASGKTFASYAEGYAAAVASWTKNKSCPPVSDDCPSPVFPFSLACKYDAGDLPFQYFAQFTDDPNRVKDYEAFAADLKGGTLPNFAFIKGYAVDDEHPGAASVTRGMAFVKKTVDAIEASPYAANTLVLITMDEGGGFFDHVSPPAAVPTKYDHDDKGNPVPYGTRVPFLAVGPFARKGAVSHVVLEHSSVVKFLELNFLGPEAVGALGNRDAYVNNLGSLLDPQTTGIVVPEGP